jgi:hypothetical protein
MAKGFVYVFSNASMPGLVKIGFTTKVPTERAIELNTTGVPSQFQVEYYCLVESPAALESAIHRKLASSRHQADREFFRLSPDLAIQAIESSAPVREHTWRKTLRSPATSSGRTCSKCGATYITAAYCPKCRIKLPP